MLIPEVLCLGGCVLNGSGGWQGAWERFGVLLRGNKMYDLPPLQRSKGTCHL